MPKLCGLSILLNALTAAFIRGLLTIQKEDSNDIKAVKADTLQRHSAPKGCFIEKNSLFGVMRSSERHS